MGHTPNIGRSVYKPPVEDTRKVSNLVDVSVLENLADAPLAPRCIREKLARDNKVYRWVSRPTVKFMGMRQYTTYSADAEDRKTINDGDAPAGVYVDAENKVCWRDDAWLAWIPRKQHDERVRAKDFLKNAQTDRAFNTQKEALGEMARRVGAKLDLSVTQSQGPEDDKS